MSEYVARRVIDHGDQDDEIVEALLLDDIDIEVPEYHSGLSRYPPSLDHQSEQISEITYSDNQLDGIEDVVDRLINLTRDTILSDNLSGDLVMTNSPEKITAQKELVSSILLKHLYNEQSLDSIREYLDYIITSAIDAIVGFGPVQPLLEDTKINEIICRWDMPVTVEKNGCLVTTEQRFRNVEHIEMIIARIADFAGRQINLAHPRLDARLPDYSRVHIIIPPLSPRGPVLTIRKFPSKLYRMEDLVASGMLTNELAQFFARTVDVRANILVIGATSSGKTTVARALGFLAGEDENIITVENLYELGLDREMKNVTPLEERMETFGGGGKITIRDLVVETLRMRPDRIIVGEVRGAEALDMCDAFSTGHEGGISTIHARSIAHGLTKRLPSLIVRSGEMELFEARRVVADAIDMCVFCGRLEENGRIRRAILEVASVEDDADGYAKAHTIWNVKQGFISGPGGVLGEKLKGVI